MANGHGGKREGAGNKAGSKRQTTLRKQAEFEALLQLVKEHLVDMTSAQIASAKGINYLLIRHEDGTFSRAQNEQDIDRAIAKGDKMEIFTERPHTPAFTDLMNRVFGVPPKRLEMTGADGGAIEVRWKDE